MDSSQNNPFGSFSSGGAGPSGFSASASNGAGDDIILSGAAQKRSNKKLIIGIVVGVVLLIGAVVGFLMMQNGMHNASNTTKEKFYKYANYVLYNQDSNTKLDGAYDENSLYAITEIKKGVNDLSLITTDDSDNTDADLVSATVFFDNAEVLWNNFYESLDKKDSDLMSMVDEYKNTYELFKSIVMIEDSIIYGDAARRLEEVGENGFDDWVESRYYNFVNSNSAAIREYGEKATQYYLLYKNNYPGIENAECTVRDDEKVACIDGNFDSVANMIIGLQSELIEVKNDTKEKVASLLWAIADELNGENQNE